MKARQEYRNRNDVQVAVLDALVDRNEAGITVFELRSRVDADIDELETALSELKDDGLLSTGEEDGRTVIIPDERIVPEPDGNEDEPSVFDRIKEKLPL